MATLHVATQSAVGSSISEPNAYQVDLAAVSKDELTSQSRFVEANIDNFYVMKSSASYESVIAADGISLGAHITFDSQRPSGAVPDNLFADATVKVNAALSFRLTEDADVLISSFASKVPGRPGYYFPVPSNEYTSGYSFKKVVALMQYTDTDLGYLGPSISDLNYNGVNHLQAGNYLLTVSLSYTPESWVSSAIQLGSSSNDELTTVRYKPINFASGLDLSSRISVQVVPEPATAFLMGVGLAGIGVLTRRRRAGA